MKKDECTYQYSLHLVLFLHSRVRSCFPTQTAQATHSCSYSYFSPFLFLLLVGGWVDGWVGG